MTLTVHRELEQGSGDWLAARCGVITASTIGRLIAVGAPGPQHYDCPECHAAVGDPCTSKSTKSAAPIKAYHAGRADIARLYASDAPPVLTVADSDTSRALLRTLAAERITSNVEDIFVNYDMQRGTDDEPYARDEYAAWAKVKVDEVGFMVREEPGIRLGYSPDGLVGDAGLIEIKSRRQPRQLETILDGEVPTENLAQIHAGMWVSDRKWCDYISYRDGMHLYVKRVHRDPLWDKAIEEAATHAEQVITQLVTTYAERVKDFPHIEKRPELDDIQI